MTFETHTIMKTQLARFCAPILVALSLVQAACGQGTAFTYQGVLNFNGGTPSGNYDFQVRIYDGPTGNGGFGISGPFLNVPVANGVFTLTLDFGSAVFTGCATRWLEIDVRASGTSPFYTLSPRTQLTPTPYAISAYVACSVQDNGVLSSSIASGQVVKSLNGLKDAVTLSAGPNVTLTPSGNNIQISASGVGSGWALTGNVGTIPGVNFLGTMDNTALDVKVNNTTALEIRPAPTLPNIVGGLAAFRPSVVSTNASGVVIAGGMAPSGVVTGFGGGDFMAAYDDNGTIGGGFGNKVGTDNNDTTDAAFATVAGGVFNGAAGYAATVAGGDGNLSAGSRSFVGGGYANEATGDFSTLGGGFLNASTASYTTISGGSNNICSAVGATVPGGVNNGANGKYSFAAGQSAIAANDGAFVWADSQAGFFTSTANDQFSIRARGGVRLNTDTSLIFGNTGKAMLKPDQGGSIELGDPTAAIFTTPYIDFHHDINPGAQDYNVRIINDGEQTLKILRYGSVVPMALFDIGGLTVNGTFVSSSDRNAKENFQPVDANEVLAKVAALPLTKWNYRDDTSSTHIGPMAQDFYAAFGVGPDDKHIATIDADGVALAAIQGLNQRLKEKDAAIEALQHRLERLEASLSNKREGAAR
jgi:hypothetical protein